MVEVGTFAGQPQGMVRVEIWAQAGTGQVEQTEVVVTVWQEVACAWAELGGGTSAAWFRGRYKPV
jgi:hypothetical protein